MLTKVGCQERIEMLLERLADGCQAIVLADPRHIGYFTGYFRDPTTLNVYGQSYLVIQPDGSTTLIVDNWQEAVGNSAHADSVEVFSWYDEEAPANERRRLATRELIRFMKQNILTAGTIGVERQALSVGAADRLEEVYPNVDLRNLWNDLVDMRLRKLPDELECIRGSLRALEASYAAVRRELQPGMTELDAYSIAGKAAMRVLGEPSVSAGDLISGQERTVVGVGPPTSRVIQKGDLLIMDYGLGVGGYRADLCNTFLVGGQPTDEQQERFKVLESALAVAEDHLRAGVRAQEIYNVVIEVIIAAGLERGIWGHIGHGLGLDHPEAPFIVKETEEVLQAGNVIAVEPGIYLEGWGGMRIEDNYVITETGYDRLSNHEKGL